MIFAHEPIKYLSNYDNWILACQLIQYVMYVLCQEVVRLVVYRFGDARTNYALFYYAYVI